MTKHRGRTQRTGESDYSIFGQQGKLSHQCDLYILIPHGDSGTVSDGTALRVLNRLHRSTSVDKVYLSGEDYPLIRRYCQSNDVQPIPLDTLPPGRSLTERVLDDYKPGQDTSLVFIGRKPSEDLLKKTAERLAKTGFNVEIRSIFY